MNTKAIVALGSTAVLSLAAGAVGGYFYARKQLSEEFDAQLKNEVAQAKRFYSRLHKRDENDMPHIVANDDMLPLEKQAAQAMQHYQGNNTLQDTPKEEPVYEVVTAHDGEELKRSAEHNVFDSPDLNEDEAYQELIRNRTEEAPYIITLGEYCQNEYQHEQSKLVYFQGDGILVDDRDDIIDVPDDLVGEDNLVKFGHFSGDPRLVFVRNDSIGHDFEITAHEGKYAYVVLGLDPDPVSAGE